MIDRATIDRIFDAANIEEVVADFVELKKRGVNLIGCCPFHNEKTPSFTVSAAKGIYKCFGCGEGGNAVSFVMKHEKMSYVEALRYLAKKYNIEIEEREETPEEIERRKKREGLQVLLNRAKTFYTDQLTQTVIGNQQVIPFFEQKGITKAIIEKFEIGFTGTSTDRFTTYALSEGFKKDALLTIHLSVEEEGKLSDLFKRRIVFPITTKSGRISSFYGQKSKAEPGEPIHLVGPETTLFSPDKEIFGLYQAKNSVVKLKNCYMVDYPMDVLAMHAHNMENVVAMFKQELSEHQTKALIRFSPTISMFGQQTEESFYALLANIRVCLRNGFSLKVVSLPSNTTVETFFTEKRASEVENYIEHNTMDWLQYASITLLEASKNNPTKRAEILKALVGLIAQIPNSIVRGVYVSEMANHFNIDESAIHNELRMQLHR